MRINGYSKGLGLSLITTMLLGSNAYAGMIKGVAADADYVPSEPPTQHGFGGWNLDNVNVKITDLNFVEIAKTFDKLNGTYDPMVIGDSFESEILDAEGTIMGKLHGKDWPVGEPSGIKVVHDDNTSKSGKYPNCILTTSYLDAEDSGTGESGYLNTEFTPVPTVCSSPFQTHKRFKINMLPTTVETTDEEGYGKPIDLVFNLDGEDNSTDPRGYQIFQKINNYTGMRLDGYKVEVIGELQNAPIKFVLDLTPTKDSDDDEESGTEATFSNGLWGPKDAIVRVPPHFTEDGFFDNKRAGFEQTQMDDSNTTLIGGPDTLAGNYEELFGLWLPSKWAPYGIFHDDDNDPLTDAELVAFWGTAPSAPAGTAPAWLKGNDYNTTDSVEPWEPVTEEEMAAWNVNAEGSLYSIGIVEDTLNLGLNYVVEVGLNSAIGSKFTIRITPHVAADQTAPSYIDAEGNPILPPQVIVPEEPVTPTAVSSSSDGGSCTFNPNSKGVDMTVLLMLAAGLLYPFRRRFIK